jgi:hypothetical protein
MLFKGKERMVNNEVSEVNRGHRSTESNRKALGCWANQAAGRTHRKAWSFERRRHTGSTKWSLRLK